MQVFEFDANTAEKKIIISVNTANYIFTTQVLDEIKVSECNHKLLGQCHDNWQHKHLANHIFPSPLFRGLFVFMPPHSLFFKNFCCNLNAPGCHRSFCHYHHFNLTSLKKHMARELTEQFFIKRIFRVSGGSLNLKTITIKY